MALHFEQFYFPCGRQQHKQDFVPPLLSAIQRSITGNLAVNCVSFLEVFMRLAPVSPKVKEFYVC